MEANVRTAHKTFEALERLGLSPVEKLRGFYAREPSWLRAHTRPSASERDLRRIRELHARYYREMRAIVAESQPGERVALFCTQLLPLDAGPWPG